MADMPLPYAPGALAPGYVDAIKGFEGFTPMAAWDVNAHRNGYGTRALYPTEAIGQNEATARLHNELGNASSQVDANYPNLSPGQRAALTDLTFNAGPKWMGEGLGAAVKAGDWGKAHDLFLSYNKSEGKVLDALTKRRAVGASWMTGSPMNAAFTTGAASQGQPMPQQTPMGEAVDPSFMGKIINGFDPGSTLQNVGAWLMAGSNPGGGASLLNAVNQDKALKAQNFELSHDAMGNLVMVDRRRGTVKYFNSPGMTPGAGNPYGASPKAQEKRIELQAKNDSDQLKSFQDSLSSVEQGLGNVKELEDLLQNPNISWGEGGAARNRFKTLPGVDMVFPGGAEGQAYDKKIAEMIANQMAGIKGIRVAGPAIKFEQSATGGTNMAREANQQIIADARRKFELMKAGIKHGMDYYDQNGTFGPGFTKHMMDFYEKNPFGNPIAGGNLPAVAPPGGRPPLSSIF